VRNEFYGDVDGLILMFDVTDKTSFEALPNWLIEAREFGVSSSNTILVVVGNKIDQYPRVVTEQEVRVMSSWDVIFFRNNSQLARA
jgi:GTPase SAR1 family protein